MAFFMHCTHNADKIGAPTRNFLEQFNFFSQANNVFSSKLHHLFQSDAMLMDGLLDLLLIDP